MGDNEARREAATVDLSGVDRSSWSRPNIPKCRACLVPIMFVRTAAGKLMPLDPDPNPEGNVEIIDGLAVVHGEGNLPMFHGTLYMPHFATCPNWEPVDKVARRNSW